VDTPDLAIESAVELGRHAAGRSRDHEGSGSTQEGKEEGAFHHLEQKSCT